MHTSRFVPSSLIGLFAFTLLSLNTIFWCVPLYLFAIAKLIIPIPAWRRFCTRAIIWIAEAWITGNSVWMAFTQTCTWDVSGLDDNGLTNDGWYLVVSNHQSWVDIFVLQYIFNKRIPFLKFFLKQELIWVPIIGLAWWGLDFPFMKRYSKEEIRRRPELKGKDLETTRKACEKFKLTPVSVMNFLEGTRFTPAKHAKQAAPYQHLLRPKAGGIAFVLAAMDGQIRTMIDVTIAYPEGIPTAWDFFCGRVHHIKVFVDKRPIPSHLLSGDYTNDPDFRQTFQTWVNDLWYEKDKRLSQMLASHKQKNVA
ncbi:MAG: acyltransferase [Candidatus Promineifilaceae bacterium]